MCFQCFLLSKVSDTQPHFPTADPSRTRFLRRVDSLKEMRDGYSFQESRLSVRHLHSIEKALQPVLTCWERSMVDVVPRDDDSDEPGA